MKRILQIRFIAATIFLSFLISNSFADNALPNDPKNEQGIRMGISLSVEMYRLNGFFDKLEGMASEYRNTRARTESGVWKLGEFYAAIYGGLPKRDGTKHSESLWEAWQKNGDEWIRKYPQSPTAHIGKAAQLLAEAWRIRGSGYAHEVWPDKWEAFYKKLDAAATVLEDSREFAASDPHWYTVRIDIAKSRGEGWAKISELLAEATRKEKNYYRTYFAALGAAQPRWGGSRALSEKLIDWIVETTKAEDGTSAFSRMYWALYSNEPYIIEKYNDNEVFWPRMKKSIADKLERYPNVHNVRFHLQQACKSKNIDAISWLLEQRKRVGDIAYALATTDPATACRWKVEIDEPAAGSPVPIKNSAKKS